MEIDDRSTNLNQFEKLEECVFLLLLATAFFLKLKDVPKHLKYVFQSFVSKLDLQSGIAYLALLFNDSAFRMS